MSCKIGIIWDEEVKWGREKPFAKGHVNRTYREFSRIAAKRGAETFIANYEWYSDGKLERAYSYREEGGWRKLENVEIDVVFDKFKFNDQTRELKQEMQLQLPVLNRFELEEICKDKLLSYEKFPDFVPETWKATEQNVEDLLFDNDKVVVKPRYDFGGQGVKIIEDVGEFEPGEDLIVQAFVDSSSGIQELEVEGVHDLRVMVMKDEVVGAYLRIPSDESLISNVSLGGSIKFVDIEEIPSDILDMVDEVKKDFSRFNPAFYSVDTIIDEDGNAHVLEFNSKPGLAFYDDEEVEKRKRPVMEKIVETLVEMC